MMLYQQAIEYIENLSSRTRERPGLPSLERIRSFLNYYSSPQDCFMSFHIAGTNGKGSTTAMLDSILRQSNLKIGTFTGPHILRYNERFQIDGQPITDEQLTELIFDVKEKSEQFAAVNPELGALTLFEFLTALAFFYFAQSAVDIALFEVGMGGRFDATNVLTKLYATCITNIGLDHTEVLGKTLEKIAMEKAGIIKPNVPIITAAMEPALHVIAERASILNAKLTDSSEQNLEKLPDYLNLLPKLKEIKNNLYKRGKYQYQNALTTMCILKESGLLNTNTTDSIGPKSSLEQITIENVLNGVQNFYWPGRFQIIESEQIILDVAHNPAGIKVLRESLDHLFPGKRHHFIFACYQDKDGLVMISNLLRPGDRIYLIELPGKRAYFPLSILAEHATACGVHASMHNDISQALNNAERNRQKDEFIVGTGSFILIKLLMQSLSWDDVT